MDKATALARLRDFEPNLRRMGVGALYLFGSTARGEAGPASDIDLFFERAPSRMLSLFDMMDIKAALEQHLGRPVDLATRRSLHPLLREDIEHEAVAVFGHA